MPKRPLFFGMFLSIQSMGVVRVGALVDCTSSGVDGPWRALHHERAFRPVFPRMSWNAKM